MVDDVHVTSDLASEWRSGGLLGPEVVSHAVWRYIATRNGVVRVFPGVQLNKYYDPRQRAWYQRAVAQPGTVVVSSLYIDDFGAGHILTISQTIYEPGSVSLNSRKNE